MNNYVLSNEADLDITNIAQQSFERWGYSQASRYLSEIHTALEALAAFPNLGRDAGHLREGYYRFEHDRHTVFYQKATNGIFVVRVLHIRQLPENYL